MFELLPLKFEILWNQSEILLQYFQLFHRIAVHFLKDLDCLIGQQLEQDQVMRDTMWPKKNFVLWWVKVRPYSADANAFTNRYSPLVSFTFSKKRNQSTAEVIATRGGSRIVRKVAPILGGDDQNFLKKLHEIEKNLVCRRLANCNVSSEYEWAQLGKFSHTATYQKC